jgi:hypothetical protein
MFGHLLDIEEDRVHDTYLVWLPNVLWGAHGVHAH